MIEVIYEFFNGFIKGGAIVLLALAVVYVGSRATSKISHASRKGKKGKGKL